VLEASQHTILERRKVDQVPAGFQPVTGNCLQQAAEQLEVGSQMCGVRDVELESIPNKPNQSLRWRKLGERIVAHTERTARIQEEDGAQGRVALVE
jgi:hypothetical protein